MDTSLEMQLAQALLEIFPELTLTKDAGTGVLTIGTAQLVLTINSGGTLQEGREVGTAYSNLKSGLALGTVGAGVLGVVGALGAGAVATGHAAGQAIGRGIEAMRAKPAPVDTTTSYQVRGRQADGTLREMSTASGSGSFEGPVNETTGMPLGASPKPAYTSPDKTGVPVMSHPVKQGLREGNGETGPNFPISGPEVVPDGAKWEVKVTATGQRTKTWTLENEQIALFYFKGTNPNTGGAARLYKDGKMVKIKRG